LFCPATDSWNDTLSVSTIGAGISRAGSGAVASGAISRSDTSWRPAVRVSPARIVWCTLPVRPSASVAASRSVYSPGASSTVVCNNPGDAARGVAGDRITRVRLPAAVLASLSSTRMPVCHSTAALAGSPISAVMMTRTRGSSPSAVL
jgi:hypothetical protein